MMMLAHFNEYELQKLRCEELRRMAEQIGQGEEIGRRSGRRHPVYASTLASVGKVLVGVGSKLQEQYADEWVPPSVEAGYY
jgi:hypothetical protein